jgi:hypothetical protein
MARDGKKTVESQAMALYPVTELRGSETLRAFAYKGKVAGFLGIPEDEVKAAIKSCLENQGYEVEVKWANKTGCDIVATCGAQRLKIEVKGEGSRRQMLGNYFLCALGEMLQRMNESNVDYGIALPAHASYDELVLKLPKRVREMLHLDFYFVRRKETTHEIGVLRWHGDT